MTSEIDVTRTKELNETFEITCRKCNRKYVGVMFERTMHETLIYVKCIHCNEFATVGEIADDYTDDY